MEYSRSRGWEGRREIPKKYSRSDRILILYAWIELFNFFLLHIFLVLRLLFPRTMSSGFRNPSCQHCLGLEAEGEVTIRQGPSPALSDLCPDLFSLGDPPHSPGQLHQWEWRGGAQAFQTGLPMCRYWSHVSYPPSNGATQLHLFTWKFPSELTEPLR